MTARRTRVEPLVDLRRLAALTYPHEGHTDDCSLCPSLLRYGLFQDDEENFDPMLGAVVGLS